MNMRLNFCMLAGALLIAMGLQTTETVHAQLSFSQMASAPQQTALLAFEASYQKINQSKDRYERLELAEKLQTKLDTYLKAHPNQARALLLRAKLQLVRVAIESERGATAVDYWAFVSEVVDPIRYAALADLQTVLKLQPDKKLTAETHYWLAQYYLTADEVDQTLVDQELKAACEGAYQKACQD